MAMEKTRENPKNLATGKKDDNNVSIQTTSTNSDNFFQPSAEEIADGEVQHFKSEKLHGTLNQMEKDSLLEKRTKSRQPKKLGTAMKSQKILTTNKDKKTNALRGETRSAKISDKHSKYAPPRLYLTRFQTRKRLVHPAKMRTGWERWMLKKKKVTLRLRNQEKQKRRMAEAGDSNMENAKKKVRRIIGPNSIVVNLGLSKIKIESDYIAQTIKTENEMDIPENTEIADMNHLTVDTEPIQPIRPVLNLPDNIDSGKGMRHLFEIVDYKTLKTCRLVSHKWKKESDPIFVERSVFAFENKNAKIITESMLGTPIDIQNLFGSMEQKVNFTAFKFQYILLTEEVQKMYLNPNKNTMTHLEIENIRKVGRRLATKEELNIDKWIGQHLKKLVVSVDKWKPFTISLEKLAGISHINIQNCGLIGNVKLVPEELILRLTCLTNANIIDFVDFRNLQVLHLDFSSCFGRWKPCLNLSYCTNIKTLILIDITIFLEHGRSTPRILKLENNKYNYTNSPSYFINDYILEGTHVDKMTLGDKKEDIINFDFGHSISVDELILINIECRKTLKRGCGMKVKNLTICGYGARLGNCPERYLKEHIFVRVRRIDIGLLPSSLESLKIVNNENPIFSVSGVVNLPVLRQLTLSRTFGVDFHHFSQCSALAEVSIHGYRGVLFSGNYDFPSLKRLLLWDVETMILNYKKYLRPKVITLDALVLSSSIFRDRKKSAFRLEVFTKFRAKLVVFFKTGEKIDEETVTTLMKMKQERNLQNIAFGPVEWKTDESFKKSLVFPIVEIKTEYYLLEGHGGKAINREQLMDMIPNIDFGSDFD